MCLIHRIEKLVKVAGALEPLAEYGIGILHVAKKNLAAIEYLI
jgi:hypothetical protein